MPDDKNIPSQPDKGNSIEKGQNSLPDFHFTPPPPPPPPPPTPPASTPPASTNDSSSS
jgi:hypothetical protein